MSKIYRRRKQILKLLSDGEPYCLIEISRALGLNCSTITEDLNVLIRTKKVVKEVFGEDTLYAIKGVDK